MLWARRIPPIPSLLSTALCCQKWCLLFLSTFATELFLSALFVSTVGEAIKLNAKQIGQSERSYKQWQLPICVRSYRL